MRRVVVTGMGMVTPLGDGVDVNWRRLMAAESGIRSIQAFDTSDLATKIAGEVPLGDKANGHFNVDAYLPPKEQRKLDKFIDLRYGRRRIRRSRIRGGSRRTTRASSAPV